MERKAVSGTMLALLLIGMLALAFDIQTAKAETETSINDDLVAYWQFNECEGNEIVDSSIYGNNGTLSGGYSWVEGLYNYDRIDCSIFFTGGDTADCGNASVLNVGAGNFTLTAWVKKEDTSSLLVSIVRKGYSPCYSLYLYNFYPKIYITDSAKWAVSESSETLKDGWNFIVGTREVNSTHNLLKIYLNGNLTGVNDASSIGSLDSSNSLVISGNYYTRIDEVRIYKKSLTEEEILRLFTYVPAPPPCEFISSPYQNITAAKKIYCLNQSIGFDRIGINITDSRWVIVNCNGYSLSGGEKAFYLYNCSNVRILNCNIENSTYGIWIESCSHCVLRGNSLNNVTLGFHILQSGHRPFDNSNSFVNNTLSDAEIGFFSAQPEVYYRGNTFRLNHVENCITAFEIHHWAPGYFANNVVENCETAFYVDMHYCTLENNHVVNCSRGFWDHSVMNVYRNNTAENCKVAYRNGFANWKNTFESNTARNCWIGFDTSFSQQWGPVTCSMNNAINCTVGFLSVSYNQFRSNLAEGCTYGFCIVGQDLTWPYYGYVTGLISWKNFMEGNIAINNDYGIFVGKSKDNLIVNNLIEHNKYGMYVYSAITNNLTNNLMNDNSFGCLLENSSNNIFKANVLSSNAYGFGVSGARLLDFVQDIDVSNTVNDKPVYYWINRQNETVPLNAGYVAVINSTNISVKNLILENNIQGILLAYTSSSQTVNCTIKNNLNAFYLHESHDNDLFLNNITNNDYGIWLKDSSDNKIYHNNFINSTQQVETHHSRNIWDNGYPSGGNYWSDYTGIDYYGGPNQNETGSDGIGDTPYVIDASNRDTYPFMNESGWEALTPEQAIRDLIDTVQSMNLQQGIDNSLDAKLANVLASLEAFNAEQRNDSINKLYAFINEVEAQRGNKITNEQADYLVSETQRIIDLIEG